MAIRKTIYLWFNSYWLRRQGIKRSKTALDIEEQIKQKGWNVDLFCKSIPDMTTIVDFDKKTLQHNNGSALYTEQVLNRVCICIKAGVVGAYRYEFVEAERLLCGNEYCSLRDLVATPLN